MQTVLTVGFNLGRQQRRQIGESLNLLTTPAAQATEPQGRLPSLSQIFGGQTLKDGKVVTNIDEEFLFSLHNYGKTENRGWLGDLAAMGTTALISAIAHMHFPFVDKPKRKTADELRPILNGIIQEAQGNVDKVIRLFFGQVILTDAVAAGNQARSTAFIGLRSTAASKPDDSLRWAYF